MLLPIEETVADLANIDKQLLNSRLADLSSLNSEELRFFEQVWPKIELKRRQQIVSRLVELAEDNFELDFDCIFKSCLKDQDAEVRGIAVEGLWESEDTSLITPLVKLLEQDTSETVQIAAAMALGKFALLAELEKLGSHHISKVKQALLGVVNDKKGKPAEVRRRALEAVAPLSLLQVNEAIMEAYQSHSPRFKVSAIYAMGRNCHHSWLPILINELDSADVEMRYEAAVACGELAEKEAVPHLIRLIDDPDAEVRLAAIQALGKVGGEEAKECLVECLNNPNKAICQIAKQALHELEVNEDPLSFRG